MRRAIRIALGVIGWGLAIIGVGGIPDAWVRWRSWFGALDQNVARWSLLVTGVTLAVAAVWPERWMWWKRTIADFDLSPLTPDLAKAVADAREIADRLRQMADEIDGGSMEPVVIGFLPEEERERRRMLHTQMGQSIGRQRMWDARERYLAGVRDPAKRTRDQLLAALTLPPADREAHIDQMYDQPVNPFSYRELADDLDHLADAVYAAGSG